MILAITTSISHYTESLCNKAGKKYKCVRIGKEKVKLSFFKADMILYIEISEDSTESWLGLLSELVRLLDTSQYAKG